MSKCGVTMMMTIPDLTFKKWHLVSAASHRPGKDKPRGIFKVNSVHVEKLLFEGEESFVPRTAPQDF